ncbi:MarR family winged helix-turn-helix transcriptional regulator [Algicella marina]|uniref:MarR family transcriptional regulator n=1 Tax=Algicella marina TaxID=2683284 RepID=A0A6P1SZV3_9RHOB|nr:MarR family winged helix-turn-helix transcriptional regulator [Algicella marina]QHQ36018.1 MarR family transcriptional regulator [Algicella marina]
MDRKLDQDSVGLLFAEVGRRFRFIFERSFDRADISVTAAEARVLFMLARFPALRQHQLAAELGIAPMSLSVLIDRLENAGLVVREVASDDRRAKVLELLPAADAVLTDIAVIGNQIDAGAAKGIPKEEWERFRETARKVRKNLDTMRCQAQPNEAKDGK